MYLWQMPKQKKQNSVFEQKLKCYFQIVYRKLEKFGQIYQPIIMTLLSNIINYFLLVLGILHEKIAIKGQNRIKILQEYNLTNLKTCSKSLIYSRQVFQWLNVQLWCTNYIRETSNDLITYLFDYQYYSYFWSLVYYSIFSKLVDL